jgi:hypothetical protein
MAFNLDCVEELSVKFFPCLAVTFRSGSRALYNSATLPVKPFMAESIMTSAAVVKAMAVTLIQLMMLMTLLDFLEIR